MKKRKAQWHGIASACSVKSFSKKVGQKFWGEVSVLSLSHSQCVSVTPPRAPVKLSLLHAMSSTRLKIIWVQQRPHHRAHENAREKMLSLPRTIMCKIVLSFKLLARKRAITSGCHIRASISIECDNERKRVSHRSPLTSFFYGDDPRKVFTFFLFKLLTFICCCNHDGLIIFDDLQIFFFYLLFVYWVCYAN